MHTDAVPILPVSSCSWSRPHCSAHGLMHLPCSCAACEEQLELLKREYLPRLAREHGITEEFCNAVKVLH